jgi:hypothetical protein
MSKAADIAYGFVAIMLTVVFILAKWSERDGDFAKFEGKAELIREDRPKKSHNKS